MLTDDQIKQIMLANGFEIKPGCDDLKPYVYEAARAIEHAALTGQWLTLEEFKREPNEGYCWIVYNGRVKEAYHNYEGRFNVQRLSYNEYLTMHITHAMPINRPPLPTAEEIKDET